MSFNDYPLVAKLIKRNIPKEEQEKYNSIPSRFRYVEERINSNKFSMGGVYNRTANTRTIKTENNLNFSVGDRIELADKKQLTITNIYEEQDFNQLGVRARPRTVYILELA